MSAALPYLVSIVRHRLRSDPARSAAAARGRRGPPRLVQRVPSRCGAALVRRSGGICGVPALPAGRDRRDQRSGCGRDPGHALGTIIPKSFKVTRKLTGLIAVADFRLAFVISKLNRGALADGSEHTPEPGASVSRRTKGHRCTGEDLTSTKHGPWRFSRLSPE